MRSPLFLSAIAYICALVAATFLHLTTVACVIVSAVTCAVTVAVAVLCRRFRLKLRLWLLILVFGLGLAYGEARELLTPADPFADVAEATLVGKVCDDPVTTSYGQKCRFRVTGLDGKELPRAVVVQALVGPEKPLRYGDCAELSGAFLPSETLNPGSFDFAAYRQQHRLYGTFSALYGGDVTVTATGKGDPAMELAYHLKHRFERALSYLPPSQAVLIRGIFFGDTSGLDHRANDVLSQSGIRHCFAVSGLHVGYVLLFLNVIGDMLRFGNKRKALLILPCLFLYAAMTGFSPSVLRASVMCLMVVGANVFGRERNSFNGLGMAALALLIWEPLMLTQAGFQLSFLAIFSILTLVPWLKLCFPRPFPGREAFFVTVAAQIGMIPILAYMFHVVSFISFFISTVCCLLVGGMVVLCFVALVLAVIQPFLGAVFLIPCGLLGEAVFNFAAFGTELPFAYIYKGDFGLLWLLLTYAAIAAIVFLPKLRNGGPLPFAALCAVFVVFLVPFPFSAGEDPLEVTFLAVGEGDAIYIHTPAGDDLMMDVGDMKEGNVSYYTIRPFLLAKGVNKLDTVYFSHNDADHSGGFPYLIDTFAVDEICLPDAAEKQFRDRRAEADVAGAAVTTVKSGDVLDLGNGVTMEVLWPDADSEGESNELSLVAKMVYGNFELLFTGDVEDDGLRALNDLGATIAADVLKIPHHGSKNSFDPDFYGAVAPEAVVISVGKNGYGHPNEEVTAYWQEKRIPCYRTDLDGAVTVTSDGNGYEITTFKKRR